MLRRAFALAVLASSSLAACTSDVCELDMLVQGARYYDIAWKDATCTATEESSWYDGEHFGPYVALEHDDQGLWIYFDDLEHFAVGTHTVSATFEDRDYVAWDYGGCQASLTEAEYERWTKHDHWILDGTLSCPSEWSSVWLSDVSFSIYSPAGD